MYLFTRQCNGMRHHTTLFSFRSLLCLRSRLLGVVIHPLLNSTVTRLNALTRPLSDEKSVDYYLISVVISIHALLPLILVFPHF